MAAFQNATVVRPLDPRRIQLNPTYIVVFHRIQEWIGLRDYEKISYTPFVLHIWPKHLKEVLNTLVNYGKKLIGCNYID